MMEFIPAYKDNWDISQVKHYLKKWYYFDHNINYLSKLEIEEVRSLYYRLSYLSEHERKQLASYYYHPKISNNCDLHTPELNSIRNKLKVKREEPFNKRDANTLSINIPF